MNNTVRAERNNWRDEKISHRHRCWGYDCPAVDIDFMVIEYDRRQACALVDYKHENLPEWHRNASSAALANMGTRAGIPAFVCVYADDFSWLYPIPLNDQARKWIPESGGRHVTEQEWVKMLYEMRGRELPDNWDAELRK